MAISKIEKISKNGVIVLNITDDKGAKTSQVYYDSRENIPEHVDTTFDKVIKGGTAVVLTAAAAATVYGIYKDAKSGNNCEAASDAACALIDMF